MDPQILEQNLNPILPLELFKFEIQKYLDFYEQLRLGATCKELYEGWRMWVTIVPSHLTPNNPPECEDLDVVQIIYQHHIGGQREKEADTRLIEFSQMFPNLTKLEIPNRNVTFDSIIYFTNLTSLSLHPYQEIDNDNRLSKITTLTYLDTGKNMVKAANILALTNLQILVLNGDIDRNTDMSFASLTNLARLDILYPALRRGELLSATSLRALKVTMYNSVNSIQTEDIESMTQLTSLNLSIGNNVRAISFEHFKLVELVIDCRHPLDLNHLRTLKRLTLIPRGEHVYDFAWPVPDAEVVKCLSGLEMLDLSEFVEIDFVLPKQLDITLKIWPMTNITKESLEGFRGTIQIVSESSIMATQNEQLRLMDEKRLNTIILDPELLEWPVECVDDDLDALLLAKGYVHDDASAWI
jgi:hypothetical protein